VTVIVVQVWIMMVCVRDLLVSMAVGMGLAFRH
jgi:hypothetical protein